MNTKAKPVVIARLTAVRSVGVRTIIEIHADATFSSFYNYFTQDGKRTSTKKQVRSANRNEGLRPYDRAYRLQPGLEAIAEQFKTMPHFTNISVRILKRREYRRLINAAPDALGLTQVQSQLDARWLTRRAGALPIYIPSNFMTIEKRMNILTGRG